MRFDRRQTYPLRDKTDESVARRVTDFRAFQALVPSRKGGVLYQRGPAALFNPINIAVGKLKHPYLYKIPAVKFTSGGFSSQAGSNIPQPGGGGGTPPPVTLDTLNYKIRGNTWALPMVTGGIYNFTVYWGDGTTDLITEFTDSAKVHQYASEGEWDIVIDGQYEGWGVIVGAPNLLEISQWGTQFKLAPLTTGGFRNSTNLVITATDSLDLSGFVTANGLFTSCTSLGVVDMSNWIPGFSFASMFASSGVTEVILGSINLGAVTSMQGMFSSSTLKSFNYSGPLTACTSLAYMFSNCSDLTEINMPGAALSLERINTFANECVALSSLDVSGFNISSLADATSAFENTGMLTDASSISAWIGGGSTPLIVEDMFRGSGITAIAMPSILPVKLDGLFASCISLESIDMSLVDSSICTDWYTAFQGCAALVTFISSPLYENTLAMISLQFSMGGIGSATPGFDFSQPKFENYLVDKINASGVKDIWDGTLGPDTATYDAILTNWGAQTVIPGATFEVGPAKYTPGGAAEAGRQSLEAQGWIILDGGPVI